MDRSIPEEDDPQKKVTQPKSYFNQNRIANLRKGAMGRRLRAKIMQEKNGTPHQQHVAHEKHMENVKNNPRKYG